MAIDEVVLNGTPYTRVRQRCENLLDGNPSVRPRWGQANELISYVDDETKLSRQRPRVLTKEVK
jgi:hypothetical protein